MVPICSSNTYNVFFCWIRVGFLMNYIYCLLHLSFLIDLTTTEHLLENVFFLILSVLVHFRTLLPILAIKTALWKSLKVGDRMNDKKVYGAMKLKDKDG